MDNSLPLPLTPTECDLRDFAFMPLDVVRLRDSDLAALESPEACWAAVLLWCASWHQIPAASLPDDDRVLANLAGFGRVVKEWQKIRSGALRGWVKCSDGRLYHPVIAEKANEAYTRKLEQGWRTECARIKKHNQRYQDSPEKQIDSPTFEEWLSSRQVKNVPRDKPKSPAEVPGESESNRQGEGQGQRQGNNKEIKGSGNSGSDGGTGDTDAAPLHVQLAVELRKAGVSITSAHPNVITWAERGLTVAQALEAVEIARQRKPDGNIAPNYLLGIVEDILNPPTPRSSGKTETAWWTSEGATLAKGKELELNPRVGESMGEFQGRIRTEIERRKGKAA